MSEYGAIPVDDKDVNTSEEDVDPDEVQELAPLMTKEEQASFVRKVSVLLLIIIIIAYMLWSI